MSRLYLSEELQEIIRQRARKLTIRYHESRDDYRVYIPYRDEKRNETFEYGGKKFITWSPESQYHPDFSDPNSSRDVLMDERVYHSHYATIVILLGCVLFILYAWLGHVRYNSIPKKLKLRKLKRAQFFRERNFARSALFSEFEYTTPPTPSPAIFVSDGSTEPFFFESYPVKQWLLRQHNPPTVHWEEDSEDSDRGFMAAQKKKKKKKKPKEKKSDILSFLGNFQIDGRL